MELARLERAPSAGRRQEWKEALHWFFRRGREPGAAVLRGVPSLARQDLGRTAWAAKYCLEKHALDFQTRRMALIQRSIHLDYALRVAFTRQVFSPTNPALRDALAPGGDGPAAQALVVLDEALALGQPDLARKITEYFAAHADRLKLACPPIIMEGGERVKNSYFHVSEVHSQIDRYHIDRHSYVLAVGGGALLDMVGLAAATAHRGVRLVRLPTTTLSQCDSGVGVKNGINAFGKKNFVGTFAPPFAVLNDFDLLASLPPRDKRAGYVEAVKVALIRDRAFFEEIERAASDLRAFQPDAMRRLIRRSAELHLEHIATSGDPFEFGAARPLDFGHWAAHKLEPLSEYRLRHGEAVALGVALDTVYSRRAGFLDAASAERTLALLERLGFDLFASELLLRNSAGAFVVLEGLKEFREHLGGELTITLLHGIGRGFEVHAMETAQVSEAIEELRGRQAARPREVGSAPA